MVSIQNKNSNTHFADTLIADGWIVGTVNGFSAIPVTQGLTSEMTATTGDDDLISASPEATDIKNISIQPDLDLFSYIPENDIALLELTMPVNDKSISLIYLSDSNKLIAEFGIKLAWNFNNPNRD